MNRIFNKTRVCQSVILKCLLKVLSESVNAKCTRVIVVPVIGISRLLHISYDNQLYDIYSSSPT